MSKTCKNADYPFVGIPKGARLPHELRLRIVREFGKLADEEIARMIEPESSLFTILKFSPLPELPLVQVEVFQSLIELKGGLSTIRGGEFIRLLGNEMRDPPWNPVCRKAGSGKLLPPMEWLQAWDAGLYMRSQALLQYVCDVRDGKNTFDYDWDRFDGRCLPGNLQPASTAQDH